MKLRSFQQKKESYHNRSILRKNIDEQTLKNIYRDELYNLLLWLKIIVHSENFRWSMNIDQPGKLSLRPVLLFKTDAPFISLYSILICRTILPSFLLCVFLGPKRFTWAAVDQSAEHITRVRGSSCETSSCTSN